MQKELYKLHIVHCRHSVLVYTQTLLELSEQHQNAINFL